MRFFSLNEIPSYMFNHHVQNVSTKQFVLRMKVLPTMRALANWKNLNLI